jgi:hypothetical protein
MAFLYGWFGHIGPDPLFESTSYLAVRRMRNRRLYLRGLLVNVMPAGRCPTRMFILPNETLNQVKV